MSEKNMKENLQSFAVKKVLDYMEGDLDKNLPKLLEWADKFDKENLYASQRKVFHDILEHPDNNWYQMIKSLWTDIDPEVRKVFFENFIVNAALVGSSLGDPDGPYLCLQPALHRLLGGGIRRQTEYEL